MKLLSLSLKNFRGVVEARVSFGPRLNVLYGPNELGKSTIVESIRAAFLLPTGSKEADSFVPWGTDEVPLVVLEFEITDQDAELEEPAVEPAPTPASRDDEPAGSQFKCVSTVTHSKKKRGNVYRITKSYGSGARNKSLLEKLSGSGNAVAVAKGRDVDGKLRELLGWGITSPGGKGAPRGIPSSYLVTALLGNQADETSIFDADLDRDGTTSGREQLTRALGALAEEPLVRTLLDRLEVEVDKAFTKTGRTKTGSPIDQLTTKCRQKADEVEDLKRQLRLSEQVEEDLRRLASEHETVEAELRLMQRKAARGKDVLNARTHFEEASRRHSALQAAATHQDVSAKQLDELKVKLADAEMQREQLLKKQTAAASRVAALQAQASEVKRTVVAQRESRETQLRATKAEAERRRDAAQQAIKFERSIATITQELNSLAGQQQAAQQRHVSLKQIAVLEQLRGQELSLQANERDMLAAQCNVERLETDLRTAQQRAEQVEREWLSAREEATRAATQFEQTRSSADADRNAREAELQARCKQADLRIEQVEAAINAADSVAKQAAEVTHWQEQLDVLRGDYQRAERALQRVALLIKRNEIVAIQKAHGDACNQQAHAEAALSKARAVADDQQQRIVALTSEHEAARKTLADAEQESRRRQLRREQLQSRLVQNGSAISRTQDEHRSWQSMNDANRALTKATEAQRQLTAEAERVEFEFQQATSQCQSNARRASQRLVAMIGIGVGLLVAIVLTLMLSVGTAAAIGFTIVGLIAFAVCFQKWMAERQQHSQLELQRERLREQRQLLVSKQLLADNSIESARRDVEQWIRRCGDGFANLEAAETGLQKRLVELRAEANSVNEELLALDRLAPAEGSPEHAQDLERQLKTVAAQQQEARSELDRAQQEVFRAVEQTRAIELRATQMSATGPDLAELDRHLQELAFSRADHETNVSDELHPTECTALVDQALSALQQGETQFAVSTQRLDDLKRDAAGRRRALSNEAAQMDSETLDLSELLLTAKGERVRIDEQLRSLEVGFEESLKAAEQAHKAAMCNESHTSDRRQSAKADLAELVASRQEAKARLDGIRQRAAESQVTMLRSDSPMVCDPDVVDTVASLLARSASERASDEEARDALAGASNSSREILRVDLVRLNAAFERLIAERDGPSEKPITAPVDVVAAAAALVAQLDAEDARLKAELRQHGRDLEQLKVRVPELRTQAAHEVLAASLQTIAQCEQALARLDDESRAEVAAVEGELRAAQSENEQLLQECAAAQVNVTLLTQQRDNVGAEHQSALLTHRERQTEAAEFDVEVARAALSARQQDYAIELGRNDPPSESELSQLDRELICKQELRTQLDAKLHETRGKLTAAGGAVLREKLASATEEYERLLRESEQEEQKSEATKYLFETLQAAQSKHAAHLGHSLAKAIGEQFAQLTGSRYSDVELKPSLSLAAVKGRNAGHEIERLSVGTQHQLATMLRLSLAAHLKTSLVLDDQLAHSDGTRLEWFRQRLRNSVDQHETQVVVITCRPQDYFDLDLLPERVGANCDITENLHVVDLSAVVTRP